MLLLFALSFGSVLAADKPDPVRAVMFELTYTDALVITHAQVIGGFPSVDACKDAMSRVVALGASSLEPGEKMQLQCSGIRSGKELSTGGSP